MVQVWGPRALPDDLWALPPPVEAAFCGPATTFCCRWRCRGGVKLHLRTVLARTLGPAEHCPALPCAGVTKLHLIEGEHVPLQVRACNRMCPPTHPPTHTTQNQCTSDTTQNQCTSESCSVKTHILGFVPPQSGARLVLHAHVEGGGGGGGAGKC